MLSKEDDNSSANMCDHSGGIIHCMNDICATSLSA